MLEVKPSGAGGTTEHDVVGVVDELLGHWTDRIFAVVLFAILLLLLRGLALPEWNTRGAVLLTVRASSVIRSCSVFFHGECDTATTLENKVVLTNFGDQMFSRPAMSDTALVICVDTALTVDQRGKVSTVLTGVAVLNMTSAEWIRSRQVLEGLASSDRLWKSDGSWF